MRFEAPRTEIQDPEKFQEPSTNMNGRFGRLSGCVRRAGGLLSWKSALHRKGASADGSAGTGTKFPIRVETRNRSFSLRGRRLKKGVSDSFRYLQIKKKNGVSDNRVPRRKGIFNHGELLRVALRRAQGGPCCGRRRTWGRMGNCELGAVECAGIAAPGPADTGALLLGKGCDGVQILMEDGFVGLQRVAMGAQRYAQVIARMGERCVLPFGGLRGGRVAEGGGRGVGRVIVNLMRSSVRVLLRLVLRTQARSFRENGAMGCGYFRVCESGARH